MSISGCIFKSVDRKNRLISTFLALFLVFAPNHVSAALPDLGQDAATIISPYQERQIGRDAMAQIRRQLNFIDDPELNRYIGALGNKLARSLLDEQRQYQFFLIDSPVINAFALPGGFIGIHSGLVTSAASESELASVLAHEIAHVTQRHWPRMVAAQKERSGLTMAAILASLVLAGSGDVNAGGIAMAALAADVDSQLAFTRAFEREADRIGIRLLATAKLDSRAMATFFERLASANQFGDANIPEFMRTHPVTNDRIAEARNSAALLPPSRSTSSADFFHFRARTRANFQPQPSLALAHFTNTVQGKNISKAERRAARYGLALVHLRLGNFAIAGKHIARLRKQRPRHLPYRLAEADIAIAAGNTKHGLNLYRHIYNSNRGNGWIARRYAENLLAHRQPKRALRVLHRALPGAPKNPALNKLIAKAAGETGDLVQAHRAMAEYYVITGNAHEAVNQLDIASRKAKDDYYALTAIRARIDELKAIAGRNSNKH